MSDRVAGSAIVTGAGSGIGRAIAVALAGRGASVGLIDVLPEGVTELFLASVEATYVTGHLLMADGGWSAR